MTLAELAPSHQGAYGFIKNNKHPVSFIQGPPGTGKTSLITSLLGTSWKLGVPFGRGAALSDSATDHLATALGEEYPDMGAIRFHAFENEARAIRRRGKEFANEDFAGITRQKV